MSLITWEADVRLEIKNLIDEVSKFEAKIKQTKEEINRPGIDSVTKENGSKLLKSQEHELRVAKANLEHAHESLKNVTGRLINKVKLNSMIAADDKAAAESARGEAEDLSRKIAIAKEVNTIESNEEAKRLLLLYKNADTEAKRLEDKAEKSGRKSKITNNKLEIAMNSSRGMESFFSMSTLLYRDYFEEVKNLAKKYETQKAKLMIEVFKHTMSSMYEMLCGTWKVFMATSEKYFKDTMKSWGRDMLDAFSPVIKPMMFMAGAIGSIVKMFTGTKEKKEEELITNPLWTSYFADMVDLLSGMHNSLSTAEEIAKREEKKKARTLGTGDKPKGFLEGLMGFLGIGTLMTAISAAFTAIAPMILPIVAGLAALVAVASFMYGFFNTEGDFFDKIKGGFMQLAENILFLPVKLYDWIMESVFGKKPPEGGTMKVVMGYVEKSIDEVIQIFKCIWNVATSLWDIVKGVWGVFSGVYEIIAGIFTLDLGRVVGGIKTVFVDGFLNIITGFYKGLAAIVDTILGMFGIKIGLFDKVSQGFAYIFGLEWLKDIIRALPSMIVPNDLLTWAGAKKEENKTPSTVKTSDDGLTNSIDSNSDTKKRAAEKQKKDYLDGQKAITDALQDISAQGGNATAVAQGGSSGGSSGPSTSESRIPTRVSPELIGAAFNATC